MQVAGKADAGAVWRLHDSLGARRGKARRVMSAGCGAAHAMGERPRNTDPGYGVVACQVMP